METDRAATVEVVREPLALLVLDLHGNMVPFIRVRAAEVLCRAAQEVES